MLEKVQLWLLLWFFVDEVRQDPNITISGSGAQWLVDRECSGSVGECLTQDRGAVGSSLTSVTALWSLSKTHLA